MLQRFCFVFLLLFPFFVGNAQHRIDPSRMNYLFSPKPNSIIYRDTLYKGSQEFKVLFLRTMDDDLIRLYDKHQSNKIWGTILNFAGAIGIVTGIKLAGDANTKTAGWITTGTSFLSTIAGAYLTTSSQRNLALAVALFNQRHNKVSAGIGFSPNGVGLAFNF
ncbi:MAG: hypothetical protein KGO81_14865 [Bacteroidota bacterium]|nr:hypothetical protein [Bacteroidota bacterium]